MEKHLHKIKNVIPGSIAEELEIEPGDFLVSVNGKKIEDVFDYHYQLQDSYIELGILKPDGEEWVLEIDKDFDEDVGIEFESSLMDSYRSCRNHCMFCFIDQMPPGMRETLYFKDDDSRLSFLQGNYITLTNMTDHDIDRIIQYHLCPINISFHTTEPDLRVRMLHNRFAGDIFPKVQRLYEAGVEMNGQIVLCKGVNDGEHLERSISDLARYLPALRTVSVVPVGLTRFRDHLEHLEPFGRDDARKVLEIIEKWQKKLYETWGVHFIHASDEWYLLAELPLPEEEAYDGYPQLENGVGMLTLLKDEVEQELAGRQGDDRVRRISAATGKLAAPFIREHGIRVSKKFPNVSLSVYTITNDYFGEKITVSGLITGTDLISQLKGKDLGEELLLPCNMLRDGENVFLDDITVEQLEKELSVPICIVDEGGDILVQCILGEIQAAHKRRTMYEQTDSSNCRTS